MRKQQINSLIYKLHEDSSKDVIIDKLAVTFISQFVKFCCVSFSTLFWSFISNYDLRQHIGFFMLCGHEALGEKVSNAHTQRKKFEPSNLHGN